VKNVFENVLHKCNETLMQREMMFRLCNGVVSSAQYVNGNTSTTIKGES